MSRFLYGRALLRGGNSDEALKNFNSSDRCSPAVMLCQEPSEEHREYLQELIAAGGDIDIADEQGYTPLDYTIFSGDEKGREIVLGGLRRVLQGDVESQLQQRQQIANIRKAYRELFQEHLRPLLLKRGDQLFESLRISYARTLAASEQLRTLYDNFKFVWYSDFRAFGRLPRSSDALTNDFTAIGYSGFGAMPEYVIFFSYRWISQGSNLSSPDDSQHTQYQRMMVALDDFLQTHSTMDPVKLGIWMDFACIDQDKPAPGVLALPLNLAQCNAVISLVDPDYESRAWCSVEALLAHTLRHTYHQHCWYQQVQTGTAANGHVTYELQQGQIDLTVPMSQKKLRFEEEGRPKVVFLERQRHLLGGN